jgi:prolyl 4-hydroxylase
MDTCECCIVIAATKWVHVGYFRPVQLGIQDPSACVDENKNCEGWARNGECNSNSQYMLNHCLRSCCSVSPERSNISSGCSSCSTEGL